MSLAGPLDEQHAELAATKAFEVELADGPEAALKTLGPPIDRIRMRATLGILLRTDRCREAADLVRDLTPDDKWVDLGALAFALSGETRQARKMVERADESPDPLVMRRTRLAVARGIVRAWQPPWVRQSGASPSTPLEPDCSAGRGEGMDHRVRGTTHDRRSAHRIRQALRLPPVVS